LKLILSILTLALGLSVQASNEIEKIIGDNDLVTVAPEASNIPLKYRSLVDAFGHMSMGCTATHIGNGYVLTAGHCFWAGPTPLADQSCSDISIEWGMRDGVKPYLNSKCERIILSQRSGSEDFAIIKVSPVPPVAIAPEMHRRAVIGDTVTIFSHPEDLPLRWSRLCGVERLEHPGIPEGTLQHKCDTNPGSSGATIINALTLKVIGIHDGGIGGVYVEGDADQTSPTATGMNYGTFIIDSPLHEALVSLGFN
jgi:V8-like Glu-specific endopeptidase